MTNMRAIAILNAKAGLVLERGEAIAAIVRDGFRACGHSIDVTHVAPDKIEAAIDEAAARTDIDTLIVGGGDGTQSLAATKLAGRDIALGVLPFGTVNLLGRDLGIPLTIEEAVRALATAAPDRIDLAEVNGRLFHSLLGLGFFARLAGERQKARRQFPFARALAFVVALGRAVPRAGAMALTFDMDGARAIRRSAAILITNNRYREQPLRRHRLDEGLLEINLVRGVRQATLLRAGFDLIAGRWRREKSTEQIAAREVIVATRRRHVRTSLDGEIVVLESPLKIGVRPAALKVLRPRAVSA
jgi:diacylglycerol kinase family enzyme